MTFQFLVMVSRLPIGLSGGRRPKDRRRRRVHSSRTGGIPVRRYGPGRLAPAGRPPPRHFVRRYRQPRRGGLPQQRAPSPSLTPQPRPGARRSPVTVGGCGQGPDSERLRRRRRLSRSGATEAPESERPRRPDSERLRRPNLTAAVRPGGRRWEAATAAPPLSASPVAGTACQWASPARAARPPQVVLSAPRRWSFGPAPPPGAGGVDFCMCMLWWRGGGLVHEDAAQPKGRRGALKRPHGQARGSGV